MMALLRKAKKVFSIRLSLFTFSCIVSIGTLLLYNLPFFRFVINNSNEGPFGVVWLTASLVVFMLVLNFMMTYLVLFCMRIVGRILLAILSVINATAVYFILTYNVFINATTIENVFNTRYSEASGFFSWGLWLFIFVFGILPALFCLLQPVVMGKAKKMGVYCGSSLAVILVISLLNINQTAKVGKFSTFAKHLINYLQFAIKEICPFFGNPDLSSRHIATTAHGTTSRQNRNPASASRHHDNSCLRLYNCYSCYCAVGLNNRL